MLRQVVTMNRPVHPENVLDAVFVDPAQDIKRVVKEYEKRTYRG